MKFGLKPMRGLAAALSATTVLAVAGCGLFREDTVLLRSDPPITGMVANLQYVNSGAPNGLSSQNEISYHGIGANSPMKLVHTTFDTTTASSLQSADVTAPDGGVVHALGMDRWNLRVGLTEYLDAKVGTYEMRDYLGNRMCGAKVRITWKPNLFQMFQDDKYHRAFDSIAYYSVPCAAQAAAPTTETPTTGTAPGTEPGKPPVAAPPTPRATLDLKNATFMSLVITQQMTPRVTGKPILFNRGHSVTVVGGKFANLRGTWWESAAGLLNGSNIIVEMVRDLNKKENAWQKFSDTGETGSGQYGGLVYSAGDADTYASWDRFFLNRQSAYLVNFRSAPDKAWQRVLIDPKYNIEWNDWSQNWEALKGEDAPNIDDLIDQETGLPKNLDDPDHENSKVLKEVETSGCQNCPNPTLEQIQFVNPDTGQPIYAMTIRGYLGAESSLFMLGKVPNIGVNDALNRAEERKNQLGYTQCPIKRDAEGKKVEDQQYSAKSCSEWLREGALWDMLTGNPASFGFDMVGQFRVRDNSSYASDCSGSGSNTYCTTVVTERRMDANYLLSDVGDKALKAWICLQLLGEVGMRTLGLSYASGQYDGSGITFAMAQLNVYNGYYSNLSDPKNTYANPELVFGLDARALQTPYILGKAGEILYGSAN